MADVRNIDDTLRVARKRDREHASPWKLGGLTVKELGKRVWAQMDVEHDDVFGRSAALAYYFFLAIFPGMLFLLTIFGLVVGNHPSVQQTLMRYLAGMMPGQANQLLQRVIQETALHAAGWLLIVGILGALWSASSGFSSLVTALNVVYGVKEGRPWWKARAISVGLTIVVGVLVLLAILATVIGGWIATQVGGAIGLSGPVQELWRIAQYVVAFLFVVLAFAVLYRWGPDVKNAKWQWITPGAAVGVLLWIAASIGLRIYLHFFNSYAKTYGSVGAVIILMLWFYITGLAMLIGGEINSEIEHAAAEHGRADAKARGEKSPPAA